MTRRDHEPQALIGEAVEAFIRRYVAISDVQALALTLFVVHTHAFEAAESTPYIRVTSVGPGSGKGHPHGTKILTPDGWRTIAEMRPGSLVIGSDGKPTEVLEVYDRGTLPVYRVTMNDGSSVVVDGEHLWKVDPHGNGHASVMPTSQVASTLKRRYSIPMVAPIQMTERDLPIDPYVLGVLLGDGYLKEGVEFDTDEATAAEVGLRLPRDFTLSRNEGHYRILSGQQGRLPGGDYARNGFRLTMEALGLTGKLAADKAIPNDYLYASESQRRALLAGLMDTDGELSHQASGGSVTAYSSASETLRDQVAFLVQSLGGVARKSVKKTTNYTYRGEKRHGQPSHRLAINMPTNPFLTREGWTAHEHYKPNRVIRSIKPEGNAPVICIRVAAEDSLYVTEDCIVTHNTKVLEVLELLVANPWLTGRVTGPALVRKVGADHPTLLLDETDALFTGGNASQQMLRGVLNSGYRLGGKVAYAKGSSYEELDVYCPKAFAGIGDLPSTIMDRSIPILMKKRTAFDQVERLRYRDVKDEARLPRMLAARFAVMHLERLRLARPAIPASLDDRAADVWEPLLAIADELGGQWPQRARLAAVELCAARRDADTESLPFRLLAACREVFDALGGDRLQTSRLVEWLLADGEWGDIDGRRLDARILADTLRPLGICPGKLRFGRQSLQGYERRSFVGAWAMLAGPEPVPAGVAVVDVPAVDVVAA